jgi:SAM-dependent methyltransferase
MTTFTHAGPDSFLLKLTGAVHRRFAHSRRVRVLAESIRDLGITPGRWLDIGCGDGRLAQAVMELVPGVDILGVDVKPRPDAVIPVNRTDGQSLDFPDNAFSGAILVDVLHHGDDPAAMLAEAARISRRSIIIKDHLCANLVDRCVLSFMDWFGNAPSGVDCPRRYLSLPQWDALFRETELNLEVMRIKLGLYPVTFRLLFERNMHFIARLAPIDG